MLYGPNGKKNRMIHHLVLEAFVGPRPDGMEGRHLDGDCNNNSVENLAWGTKKQNGQDKIRHRPNCSKCDKPLRGKNLMMVKTGPDKMARKCRACHNERNNARNAARRKEDARR